MYYRQRLLRYVIVIELKVDKSRRQRDTIEILFDLAIHADHWKQRAGRYRFVGRSICFDRSEPVTISVNRYHIRTYINIIYAIVCNTIVHNTYSPTTVF